MSPPRVADRRSARYARWTRSHFERGKLAIASRDQGALFLCGGKVMISERRQLCQLTTQRRYLGAQRLHNTLAR